MAPELNIEYIKLKHSSFLNSASDNTYPIGIGNFKSFL
jgi:hypothetical protein